MALMNAFLNIKKNADSSKTVYGRYGQPYINGKEI